MGLSFQRLSGSASRSAKRSSCSAWSTVSQYLKSRMPSSTSSFLEHRRLLQEGRRFGFAAVAHHALDAGAVVPAAVEEHDLTGRRQVRHITLEVPLRAFAFGGLGQRHGAALARVERVGDGRDDAALARRVAPFDHHHQPLAGVLQPARDTG
jgi:hypothetical protein